MSCRIHIGLAAVLASLLVSSIAVQGQDSQIPDARTLLLEVWRNEELVSSAQGTFKWRQTILNNGSVLNDRTESGEFAIEIDEAFRYVPSDEEYSIVATRDRVVRFSSQSIEEFPMSVWDWKPIGLTVDVFSNKLQIESVLRPLHNAALGPRTVEGDLHTYFGGTVAVEGDVFTLTCQDDGAMTELKISRSFPRRLVSITTRIPVMGADSVDLFEGTLADEGTWLGTRREHVFGDSLREVFSIELKPGSVNQPLPASMLEIPSSENRISVDLRRLDHRLSYWINEEPWGFGDFDWAISFLDMFPGLTAAIIAVLAIAMLAMIGAIAYLFVKVLRRRRNASANQAHNDEI